MTSVGIMASAVVPPASVPMTGLQLWLDADDAATFTFSSGTSVSQWSDKSGNTRHWTQATSGNQPTRNGSTNGRTTVVFDGTNDALDRAMWDMTKPVTVFVVARNTSTASGIRDIFKFNFEGRIWHEGSPGPAAGTIGMYQSGFLTTGVQWGTTTFQQVTCVFNGTSSKIARNGGLDTTGDAGGNNFLSGNTSRIGGNPSGGEYWTGDIAELLIYQREVSGTERTDIESYLQAKWGTPTPPVTSSIPTSGLLGWWDADDATTFTYSSSTVVSQWRDKSGNNHHLGQSTTSAQPNRNGTQNSRTTVVFDGSDDTLGTATGPISTVVDNMTMFAVCRRTAGSTTVSVPFYNGNTGADGYGIAVRANSGNVGFLRGALAWHSSSTADPGIHGVYALTRTSGTWTVHLNGTALSGFTTTGAPNRPSQNCRVDSSFGGAVAELLFYDRALNTTERQQVESYLKTKWGTP